MEKNTELGKNLENSKKLKCKRPIVRETKASKLRALHGNQLLFQKSLIEKLDEQLNKTAGASFKKNVVKPSTSRENFKAPLMKFNDKLTRDSLRFTKTSTENIFKFVTRRDKPSQTLIKKTNNFNQTLPSTASLVTANKDKNDLNQTGTANIPKDTDANKTNKWIKTGAIPKLIINRKMSNNEQQNNPCKTSKWMKQGAIPKITVNAKMSNNETQKAMDTNKWKKTGTIPKVTINNNEAQKICIKEKPKPLANKDLVRKSLTAIHLKKINKTNLNDVIHRAQSCADVSLKEDDFDLSPIKEPLFKTPSAAKRRSVAVNTPMTNRKVLIEFSNLSTPAPQDLKERLITWLEKRDKPGSFNHLQCFGFKQKSRVVDEENKENEELLVEEDTDSSYKDLHVASEEEKMKLANDALYDLHTLILERYPREQCQAWLDLIKSHYQHIDDNPKFWECRAALEEVRGEFTNAVTCYSKAVIKGAEEKHDESVGQLLQKFTVLNINKSPNTPRTTDRSRSAVLNSHDVFKSTIINFAVQERSAKKGEPMNTKGEHKFVATPVRRSTRRSRSCYTSKMGETLCSALSELEDSVRDSCVFQVNKAFK